MQTESEEQLEVFYKLLKKVKPSWNAKFFKVLQEFNPYFYSYLMEYVSNKRVEEFIVENRVDKNKKNLLMLSDAIILEKNLEKYREPVFCKVLEGLEPSNIPYFVNSFLIKGKSDVLAKDINNSKNKK